MVKRGMIRAVVCRTALGGALLLALAACGGGGGPKEGGSGSGSGTGTGTPAAAPAITSFGGSPNAIASGQSSTLSWTVTGANALSLDPGNIDVTGKTNQSVSPTADTTYTLTAKGPGGSTHATALVQVTASPSAPVIGSFAAAPASISNGQSSTLSWTVTGATSLTLNPGNINVTGTTSRLVSPSATTAYTLSATGAGGTSVAHASVEVTTSGTLPHYVNVYDGALDGNWIRSAWESTPIYTNYSATAPGRTGQALEVHFGPGNSWSAIGFADQKADWSELFFHYLNEFRTIEFDLYVEADATGMENLSIILEDAGHANFPNLTKFVSGWDAMTPAQRTGHWFHIAIPLTDPSINIGRFHNFMLFNGADASTSKPHFRLMNVKLGWQDDTTPPVLTAGAVQMNFTYDQLTFPFATDEYTKYRVDYGTSSLNQHVDGPADEWATSHTAVVGGLAPGTTVHYRLVAMDHRTDPNATPNQGTVEATYVLPPKPTVPPVVSNLKVDGIEGHRAVLSWTTNRPCTYAVEYQRSGGSLLTRTQASYTATGRQVLDLLEPSNTYQVKLTVQDAFAFQTIQTIAFSTTATSLATVTVAVDPSTTHAISPYIYGTNQDLGKPQYTLGRMGGNSWTTFNWENNANNAGQDWYYYNYDYLPWVYGVPDDGSYDVAARTVQKGLDTIFGAKAQAALITIPIQGYVAADRGTRDGFPEQDIRQVANYLTTRFKQVGLYKGSPFTTTPSKTDGFVYTDEYVNWVKTVAQPRFPGKSIFYSLDNEPDLWASTHSEVQLHPVGYDDLCTKNVEAAKAVKSVDANATIFGFVSYGWYGYTQLQGAPDGSGSDFNSKGDFTEYYLDKMKAAETMAGKRLVDVLDLHFYTEAQTPDGNKDIQNDDVSPEVVAVRVQAPRSLWDTTYVENSWITRDSLQAGDKAIRLIPRMKAKIQAHYPGTKFAITEYNYRGGADISGAIAQADALGVFGQEGIFAATRWKMSDDEHFAEAAFRMFRGFDGADANFGDVSLKATSTDVSKVAAYVSHDSAKSGRSVLVLINRSTSDQDLTLNGLTVAGTAKAYRMDAQHPTPMPIGQVSVNGTTWTVSLPAMSITTVEIQ
jgi:hypothetical protein